MWFFQIGPKYLLKECHLGNYFIAEKRKRKSKLYVSVVKDLKYKVDMKLNNQTLLHICYMLTILF